MACDKKDVPMEFDIFEQYAGQFKLDMIDRVLFEKPIVVEGGQTFITSFTKTLE